MGHQALAFAGRRGERPRDCEAALDGAVVGTQLQFEMPLADRDPCKMGSHQLVIFVGVLPSYAEKRVALIIGNDRYAELPQLHNAMADAQAVATLLEGLGFRVFKGENLDYRAANRLHADFEAALERGDMAFVFFSGHGVAIGAENYLLPTDLEKAGSGEVVRRKVLKTYSL